MYKILALALALTGCATTWVAKTTTPVKGGIIKYPVGSIIRAVNQSRHDDALAEIRGYCGSLTPSVTNDVILPEGQYDTNYRYVNFTCR